MDKLNRHTRRGFEKRSYRQRSAKPIRPVNLSARICRIRRHIPHIPIKIRIPRPKSLRILTHKPPNRRIIISGVIVIEARHRIILHPCEQKPIRLGGIRLRYDIAKRIVDDLILNACRGAGDRDNGADLVGEVPRRIAAGVGAGQYLVDRHASR